MEELLPRLMGVNLWWAFGVQEDHMMFSHRTTCCLCLFLAPSSNSTKWKKMFFCVVWLQVCTAVSVNSKESTKHATQKKKKLAQWTLDVGVMIHKCSRALFIEVNDRNNPGRFIENNYIGTTRCIVIGGAGVAVTPRSWSTKLWSSWKSTEALRASTATS